MPISFMSVFGGRNFQTGTSWRWWSSLIAGIAIILASLAVLAVIGTLAVIGSATTEQLDSGDLPELSSGALFAAMIAMQLVMVALVFLLARWGAAQVGSLLHLATVRLDTQQRLSMAGTLLVILALALAWAMVFPEADAIDSAWANEMLADPDARYVTLAVLIVGAPISEEMLFRGFMLPPLSKTRLGFSGAALVTSVLWALIHFYTWQGTLLIVFVGLGLAYLLWRTNSLWPSILVHAAFNSVFAVVALAG